MEHREEHRTIATAVVGSTHLPLVNSRAMNVTTATKKDTLPQHVERERHSRNGSRKKTHELIESKNAWETKVPTSTCICYTELAVDHPNHSLEVTLNKQAARMEVDTGTSVSLMGEELFQTLLQRGAVIRPANIRLSTYTGEAI